MGSRKTVWFYLPISVLVQAAEDRSMVHVEFSYEELMKQFLHDGESDPSSRKFQDFISRFSLSAPKTERFTQIQCCFTPQHLKSLIEEKQGYNCLISWKDALSLALDSDNYALNIGDPLEQLSEEKSDDDGESDSPE